MHTHLVQVISNEYGQRYLEQLGVRPNKSTLDLVQKNIPLTKRSIKTTLRVRVILGY